jgi:serralysin
MPGLPQFHLISGTEASEMIGTSSNQSIYFDSPDIRHYYLHTAAGHGADTIFGYQDSETIYGGISLVNYYGGYTNTDPYMDSMDGADLIYAGDGWDLVVGEGGDDTVWAAGGDDTVYGTGGSDTLFGESGNDVLYGAGGYYYPSDMAPLTAALDDGAADVIFGGSGNDVIYTGEGNDAAFGDAGADVMVGSAGNDTLYGGYGFGAAPAGSTSDADVIYGGDGNDIIYCDAGNDVVIGEGGDDFLWDYGGNNVFAYKYAMTSGNDTILGFEGAGTMGGDYIMVDTYILDDTRIGESIPISAQELIDATTYENGHATIHFGNSTVTILGVGDHHLIADDFLIGLIS